MCHQMQIRNGKNEIQVICRFDKVLQCLHLEMSIYKHSKTTSIPNQANQANYWWTRSKTNIPNQEANL